MEWIIRAFGGNRNDVVLRMTDGTNEPAIEDALSTENNWMHHLALNNTDYADIINNAGITQNPGWRGFIIK